MAADSDEWRCIPNADGSDWDCAALPAAAPPASSDEAVENSSANTSCAEEPDDGRPGVIYSRSEDGVDWACQLNPDSDSWDCQPLSGAAEGEPPPKKPAALRQTHGSREWTCTPRKQSTAWDCAQRPLSEAAALAHPWHWVDQRYLSPSQRCDLAPGCRGRYIEPARDWPNADESPRTAPLQASALRSRLQGDYVSFDGEVELRKGNLSLEAGRAEYRRDSNALTLADGVTLRQPGVLLRGESANIDTSSGLGELRQARFLSYDAGARASAEKIERPSPLRLKLKNASYTQCSPDNETWSIKARRIELDYASGRGVARDARVQVHGVPVLYSPWLDFPVDDRRSTGLLWPSLASSDGGLDLSVPYYINLAPNYDMTLTPRHLEARGDMLESEFRYLDRHGNWELAAAYLDDDKQLNRDRWLGSLREQGQIDQHWQTSIDYSRVSDDDYFRDLGIASLAVKRSTHLNQRAAVEYLGERWRSALKLQQYQTIADVDEPYRKLPQWQLSYRPTVDNFALEPILLLDITRFDHKDSVASGGSEITGERAYSEAGLRLPMHWRAGYLAPAVKLRDLRYSLDGSSSGNPETHVWQASLDAGLFLERPLAGGRWTQTLEPRLFYLFSEQETEQDSQPDFDTATLDFSYRQLFRDTRFTGYDRLDDADQLAVGLKSRFIDRDAGREWLSLALGQLFYFDERRVQLPGDPVASDANSEIAAEARLYPSANSWISADLLWDSHDELLTQSNIAYHYRGANNSLYNLGYSMRRNQALSDALTAPVEQVDASIALPLDAQWQLFSRWHYDIRAHHSLENLVGLSYQNCCWIVRAVYQRSVEPDSSDGSNALTTDEAILLEFQLKGLGGLGDKIASVLEETIFGYRDK